MPDMRRIGVFNRVICVFLLPALFLFPGETTAGETSFVPSIDVTAEYDDNIYYTRENEESDYKASVKPGFELAYKSELFNVRSRGYVDFLRFLDNTNLNRENYYGMIDAGVNVTERLDLKGNFSFINDTTLDSQLYETGIVTTRTDRKRYDAGGDLTYRVTERSSAGIGYNHQAVRYGSDLYVDYDHDSAALIFSRLFNNGLDRFTVKPYFGYWRSDLSSVHNYGLSLGLLHTFTETFTLEGSVGVRHTETERNYRKGEIAFDPDTGTFRLVEKDEERKDRDWGGTVNIQVKKTWTRSSLAVGYGHELTYTTSDGNAEPVEVDRIFCRIGHEITPRFRAGFEGSYYMSESESEFGDEDTRYLTLTPSLEYDIARYFSIRLAYRYSRETDRRLDGHPSQERNRVWLTFTGKFL